MSTFGKKALIWWDYSTHDRESILKYNRTPKEIQLKILETWYPIGMMCSFGDENYIYKIVDHKQYLLSWKVSLQVINPNDVLSEMTTDRPPLSLVPSPSSIKMVKRNIRLNKIIKD